MSRRSKVVIEDASGTRHTLHSGEDIVIETSYSKPADSGPFLISADMSVVTRHRIRVVDIQ